MLWLEFQSQSDILSESPTDSGIFISNPVTPQFDFPIINIGDFTGGNPYESPMPAFNGTTWPMTTLLHLPPSGTNTSTTQQTTSTTFTYAPIEISYLGADLNPVFQDIGLRRLLINGRGNHRNYR